MRRLLATIVLAWLLCFSVTGSALAAESAPFAQGDMEVQIWPGVEEGHVLVIVGVTVPDTVRLPATVRLPIVDGSEVTWAGEISSATADADIAVKPTIVKGKGGDYAEFRVGTFRRAQIELGGILSEAVGTKVSGEVEFVQSAPAKVTAFAVRVPATASELEITPQPASDPERNSAGESLYTLPSKELKPGDKLKVKFSYDTALPTAKSPMDPTTRLVTILSVAVAVVLLGLVALIVIQRRRTVPRGAEGYLDDDEF